MHRAYGDIRHYVWDRKREWIPSKATSTAIATRIRPALGSLGLRILSRARQGYIEVIFGIMEKKMETTYIIGVVFGIVENIMETTI